MITSAELKEYQKQNQQDKDVKNLALELIEMDLKQAAKNNLSYIIKKMPSSLGVQQALDDFETFGGYDLEVLSRKTVNNEEIIKFRLSW